MTPTVGSVARIIRDSDAGYTARRWTSGGRSCYHRPGAPTAMGRRGQTEAAGRPRPERRRGGDGVRLDSVRTGATGAAKGRSRAGTSTLAVLALAALGASRLATAPADAAPVLRAQLTQSCPTARTRPVPPTSRRGCSSARRPRTWNVLIWSWAHPFAGRLDGPGEADEGHESGGGRRDRA